MRIETTVQPTDYPVSLPEVKSELRIDHADEDAHLRGYIQAATEACERYINGSLINRTLKLIADDWPREGGADEDWWDGVRIGAISQVSPARNFMEIPRGPVSAISTVQWTLLDGTTTSWVQGTDYLFSASWSSAQMARITRRLGIVIPAVLQEADALEITYTAGYGSAPAYVPPPLRVGILKTIAHYYTLRGAADNTAALNMSATEAPDDAKGLWRPYAQMRV